MPLIIVATPNAPAAIGPYAQAIRAGELLFISGQVPVDSQTQQLQLFDGDVSQQTQLVLKNLAAILAAAGTDLAHVVKTTVFLKNLGDFSAMNAAYEAAFGAHRPARACVEVARLPKDVAVEIDAIAVIE